MRSKRKHNFESTPATKGPSTLESTLELIFQRARESQQDSEASLTLMELLQAFDEVVSEGELAGEVVNQVYRRLL